MPFYGLQGRKRYAVLWRCVGRDNNAQPVVSSTAEELKVRWDDNQRRVLDADGNVIAVDATVIVDRDIPPGSAMWLGRIDELEDGQLPKTGVMEVVTITNTDTFNGRNTVREVGLKTSKDALPTTADV